MPSLRPLLEAKLFPLVQKPHRYIGNELNIVRKDPANVALHGILCFPDIYDIGMSHYGSQILYHIVNAHNTWAMSRCYHPWTDAEDLMRRGNIPLYSLEYYTPIREAAWIGFTIQYELQYSNVVNMLDLAGIPVLARNRTECDPVVIAGGPCMGNPEPLADFMDACAIGDGEDLVVRICRLLETASLEHWPRDEKLRRLGDIEGVYVPSLFPVRKVGRFLVPDHSQRGGVRAARVPRLRDDFYPLAPIVPLGEVVHHRLAVEVMRGCTRGCRFCAAGTYYRPVRERGVEAMVKQVERGVASTGWREIGLLSLSTADYTGLGDLLLSLRDLHRAHRLSLSLPSTRIDALSEVQLKTLNAVSPASSFTVAPEAGSQRLRNVINKDFSDETILTTVRTLLDNNIQTLKLYFMLGLPTETDADIEDMIGLVREIATMARARSRKRMVSIAISPFSPKPFTPFQWEAMEGGEALLRKSRRVKEALRDLSNVKVSYRDPAMTVLETVIARGDRRVGELVHAAWRVGARLDGWDEFFRPSVWHEAAAEIGLSFDDYTGSIALEQDLPWSAINTGVSPDFLVGERNRAYEGVTSRDCRSAGCLDCGVCGSSGSDLASPSQDGRALSGPTGPTGLLARPDDPSEVGYYEFVYSKRGLCRFLSHRDTIDLFLRALVAAGLPVTYSHGYHPHPRVAFGPPLVTGVQGEREHFVAALVRGVKVSPSTLVPWLPEGIEVVEVSALAAKPPALETVVAAARYRFCSNEVVDPGLIDSAVDRLLGSAEAVVDSRRKGESVQRDIRPLVYNARRDAAGGNAIVAVLDARPASTCRPDDFLRALFGDMGLADFLVTREAFLRSADTECSET